jgi:hypothetical protein
MALFSLFISCEGAGSFSTQCRAENPHRAIRNFLGTSQLNHFLSVHPEWPRDFALRDVYAFIPLDGLVNLYFCGLGKKGKYVQIHIVQTVQRSSAAEKYCGPRRKSVTLR